MSDSTTTGEHEKTPQPNPSSTDEAQVEPTVLESVALDTADIYQEVSSEGSHNEPRHSASTDSSLGKETELKRYFASSPTASEQNACTFFDSLSVSTSPMMKSVSEVSMFQNITNPEEMLQEPTASESVEQPPEESGVFFSLGGAPAEGIETATEAIATDDAVEMQDAKRCLVQFRSSSYQEGLTNSQEKEQPLQATTAAVDVAVEEKPSLSKFFSTEHSGGDQEGKAFFDILAAKLPSSDQQSSGSASPTSALQEPCLTSDIHTEQNFLSSLDDAESCAYDVWIPSAQTKEFLMKLSTSEPGTMFPERDDLTMPGIIIEEHQGDAVKALLYEHFEPEANYRVTLSADTVPQNEDGLRQLIGAQCYNAAVNLTMRLLTQLGQGPGAGGRPTRHSPQSLQLWYTRLALFVKLRKFPLAEVEAEAFGSLDKPDLYYEFYPDTFPGKKGSMVPFSFRLLLAELPQFQGNHHTALNNLYRLLEVVHRILANLTNGTAEDGSLLDVGEQVRQASIKLWEERECKVYFAILNCVLSQKDYVVAIKVARLLLEHNSGRRPQLYSAIGRIYLQFGDVETAQGQFHKAEGLYQNMGLEGRLEILLNKGMIALALNNYSEAYQHYEDASKLQPKNPLFVNNMAVCLLYMGRLQDAVTLLEDAVHGSPALCLHEGLLFNVCTLYELQSSEALQKKRTMLKTVARHAGDSFNIASLKMQTAAGTPAKT
ncbi:trafficking protein particle complex subunit 12-like [Ornithodoros turicata]|uniref:trafficking protein particle complex subunit 12-like n=1 Tax=Ornithodoros turicata TaxID=34597 RepID=UPI00313930EC